MEIAITAIGTSNPVYRRPQLETAELIADGFHWEDSQKEWLLALYKATGIEYRYSVLSDYHKKPGEFEFFPNKIEEPFPSTAARMQIFKDNALNLALDAIEKCLAPLENFTLVSITHVITVSCTGMYAPGLDIEIIQQLGLATHVKRTAINFMGCYGVFNALKVADSICKSEPDAKVLVISVELCTLHLQNKMDMDTIISNALFSDGAAALLIQAASFESKKYLSLQNFYCDLLPSSDKEMAWSIGDFGFDIVLSSFVPKLIASGIATFTAASLAHFALSQQDIDFYAIHPGGIKILEACQKGLNISASQNKYSYQVLRNYGNMSSATTVFVLKAIWDDLTPHDHHKIIFSCAFGPGLTVESMLLKINN